MCAWIVERLRSRLSSDGYVWLELSCRAADHRDTTWEIVPSRQCISTARDARGRIRYARATCRHRVPTRPSSGNQHTTVLNVSDCVHEHHAVAVDTQTWDINTLCIPGGIMVIQIGVNDGRWLIAHCSVTAIVERQQIFSHSSCRDK